jgi:hypothetical protein
MANKRTGRGTILFGLFVLLAGLVGAVVLLVLAQRRDDDAIRDLARAPVGCETVMSFKDTGTFFLYIEHLGTLETIDGNCETPDNYSRDVDDPPAVEIEVRADDESELDLDRLDEEFTYSLDSSFAGTATRQVEIESTGNYVVSVDSQDGNDFVIAVGRNPAEAGDTMRFGAIASGLAGVVLGLILVLIGVRRRRRARRLATTYTAGPEWQAGTPLVTSPPMMQPPPTQPPTPQHPGGWAPVHPVGPPVWSPAHTQPSGPHAPVDPAPGPMAPPHVFAPPVMPNPPASPPTPSAVPPPPPTRSPFERPDTDIDTEGAADDDRHRGG